MFILKNVRGIVCVLAPKDRPGTGPRDAASISYR